MERLFACPQRNLSMSWSLLTGGLVLLLLGIAGAYFVDGHLRLQSVVAAHAFTILGPTLLKLGYVLRLIAQHQMRKDGREACCVTG
ncbi:transmembrane sensor/regulator PpyR [Pseudomonas nitroreducens]|uniref:transmembrane sensor/regulator PpyR n=1 Tax=Pseudomonas TaxID=286 RepID=UPI0007EE617D|nr:MULTISPECIES: transmembrane sensor/regulator PpyR [Pseudomonas]MDG9858429.1 transmembrane sensor/regulator PpyR [Pseudomonas nitroreducens]MDH1072583.1 transmembrane sensor/regulator PpyR [Pseudomonas nitroreducens]NMZ72535.1 transmembrane sensor/regulator PpyR [Pseudomonas nitroreducens]OBY58197.1 transmembrane sensor/regulator PpyR [Pseudomonas sp. AU12215]